MWASPPLGHSQAQETGILSHKVNIGKVMTPVNPGEMRSDRLGKERAYRALAMGEGRGSSHIRIVTSGA